MNMSKYAFVPPEFRPFEFEMGESTGSTASHTLRVQRDSNGRIVLQKELEYDQYPDENRKLMAFLLANGVVSKEEAAVGAYTVEELEEPGMFRIMFKKTGDVVVCRG